MVDLENDLAWITNIRSDLNDFAKQLNGTKTKCDCCSLMKWDDFGQGVLQVSVQTVVSKLTKLKSLMEDQVEAESKS